MSTPMNFVHRLTVLARAIALMALLSNVSFAAQYDDIIDIIQSLEKIGFSDAEIATEIRSQFGSLDESTLNQLEDNNVNPVVIKQLRGSKDSTRRAPSATKNTAETPSIDSTTMRHSQEFSRVDELYETIENLTRLGFTDDEIYARLYEEQDLPNDDDIDELDDRGVSEQLVELLRRGDEPVRGKKRTDRDRDDEDNDSDTDRNTDDDKGEPHVTHRVDGLTIPISRLRQRLARGETLEEIILAIAEDGYSVIIDNDTIQELQEDGRLLDVMVPLIDPDADTSVSMTGDSNTGVNEDDIGFLAGSGRRSGSSLLDVDSFDGDSNTRISQLLTQAQAAFDNLRLTTPKGDSAFDYYNQILDIEPDNAQARIGLNNIVDRYIELARSAAGKGQRRTAKRYLSTAKRISPASAARIDSAKAAMMPAFDPDQLQSISEAKRAYLNGKLTKPAYQAVVARLKSQYRKTVSKLRARLENGEINRVEYKQKVRAAKIELQG